MWALVFACPIICTKVPLAARPVTYDWHCKVAQCGQACVALYPDSDCGNGPVTTWSTYNITDTGGIVTAFDLGPGNLVSQIKSIGYPIPSQNSTTGGCPCLEFFFYDTNNKIVQFTYITPGQLQSPCISFNGSQVASYSGVTLTMAPPEELVEWADEGSP